MNRNRTALGIKQKQERLGKTQGWAELMSKLKEIEAKIDEILRNQRGAPQ